MTGADRAAFIRANTRVLPVPHAPGIMPLLDGSPRATAPSLDQHGKEIRAELGV